jgi:hypothetical protein
MSDTPTTPVTLNDTVSVEIFQLVTFIAPDACPASDPNVTRSYPKTLKIWHDACFS